MAPAETSSREYAISLDRSDALKFTRDEFLIPTKAEAWSKSLIAVGSGAGTSTGAGDASTAQQSQAADDNSAPCTYLVGNSLGLQPRRTATRLRQYLDTWATQGVQGHFKPLEGSPLPTWLDADAAAASMMAPIVGADPSEVAVMQSLTANLHFLMSAFYRPDPAGRHKVILEAKAFPSDHFLVETQIRHHGLSTESSMVLISPPGSQQQQKDAAAAPAPVDPLLPTERILAVIDEHAESAALLLLPGIQYYTGQLLDIPRITAHARSRGVFVIWDLAHAAGNADLRLHDWDVDAAAWCTYKYLNAGPGCIGGLFVHERHTRVSTGPSDEDPASGFTNRLAGWWGNDKATRFGMSGGFHAAPGAAGFQVSNPSIVDITCLCASLEVFELAGGMAPLREKSRRLTAYLEALLRDMPAEARALFTQITSADPDQRGAQLSLRLEEGLLDKVMDELLAGGVLVDERRPDVIRVAPAPLYNTFEDCFNFVQVFASALAAAKGATAA
ncbi:probable Kynureninase 1 [Cephalotrichum gorgonifer]|uniref:Kynureninase n=1 Tax=Cephalotrichum gorgonifer TaxID=2041049 RepID=A0AAE8MYJ1_9PEZI|nr:probable Kynureninase 1 [Cephalotrichum gorgonifer]